MKKIVFLTAVLAMAACNMKTVVPTTGEGQLEVSIYSEGDIQMSARTKTEGQTIEVDLPASLTLDYGTSTKTLSQSSNTYSGNISLSAGTYSLKAYNYANLAAALEANDNRGDAYYYGENTEEVTISAGVKSSVAFGVEVANSLVRVIAEGFADDNNLYEFTSAVVSGEERSVSYTEFADTENGWFAAGETLKVVISYSYNGTAYTKTIESAATTAAKSCYNFTVSPASSGVGEITITVNNVLTLVESTLTLDPESDEAQEPEEEE